VGALWLGRWPALRAAWDRPQLSPQAARSSASDQGSHKGGPYTERDTRTLNSARSGPLSLEGRGLG